MQTIVIFRLALFSFTTLYALYVSVKRKIWADYAMLAILATNLISYILDITVIEDNIDLYVIYELLEGLVIIYILQRLNVHKAWLAFSLLSLFSYATCIFILPHFAISYTDIYFTSQYKFLDTDEYTNYKILDSIILIPLLFSGVWNINKSNLQFIELKLTVFLIAAVLDKAVHAFFEILDSFLYSNLELWIEVTHAVLRGNTIVHFALIAVALTLKR